MDDSKKKTLMLVVIISCLVLVCIISFARRSNRNQGIESIKRGDFIWMMCSNPQCNAEYQIDKKDYLEYVYKNIKGIITPAMPCEKCNRESAYKAYKCEKCGTIFCSGSVQYAASDTCPECGFSKVEEMAKSHR